MRKYLTKVKRGPCRRTIDYRYFDKGLKDYQKEINIVEVLRQQRYYTAVVKSLIKK